MSYSGAEAGGAAERRPTRRLESLDDLVTTVDDLVRGLDDAAFTEGLESEPAHVVRREVQPAAPVVHSRAFVVGLMVALVVFELVVLAWLLSHL